MNENSNSKRPKNHTTIWVLCGVAVGAIGGGAIGAITGLVGLGLALGMAIGAIAGYIFGVPASKRPSPNRPAK